MGRWSRLRSRISSYKKNIGLRSEFPVGINDTSCIVMPPDAIPGVGTGNSPRFTVFF